VVKKLVTPTELEKIIVIVNLKENSIIIPLKKPKK